MLYFIFFIWLYFSDIIEINKILLSVIGYPCLEYICYYTYVKVDVFIHSKIYNIQFLNSLLMIYDLYTNTNRGLEIIVYIQLIYNSFYYYNFFYNIYKIFI